MKVIVVYDRGAWKFYALIKSPDTLAGQLRHLETTDRKYQVIDVENDDFNKIEDIIDQLNS